MTLPPTVVLAACLLAGGLVGRVIHRSGLTLDGMIRGAALTGELAAFQAWLLAAALLWLAAAVLEAGPWAPLAAPAGPGPVAALIGGLAGGLAVSILADDPVTLVLDAGRTRVPAITALLAWGGGVVAGTAGPLALLLEGLRRAGPAELRDMALGDLLLVPRWVLPAAAGIAALLYLIRQPVVVRSGGMEWPRAGGGLAVAAAVVWLVGGGRAMIALGLAAYGLRVARNRDGWWPGGMPAWPALAIRTAGGFVLGLVTALVAADPASRFLPGLARWNVGGVIFATSFGCGAYLMALLEWKMRGRPGAAPDLGRGV